MEGLYSNNNLRIPKIKGINGNVSPINLHIDNQFAIGRGRYHQSMSPSFDPYTSDNLDNMNSTLIRYLRSVSPAARIVPSAGDGFTTPAIDAGKYLPMIVHQYSNSNNSSFGSRGSSSVSPLSAVENLDKSSPVFATPVKVEEDVLVMDGILVGSVSGGSSSSSSSPGNSLYKTDICRSWEDSGSCRYGSKCQFAHGKEEMRPTRFLAKNKSEAQIMCKSYATTGSCIYGTKCRFVHQVMTAVAAAEVAAGTTHTTASPIKPEHASSSSRDWLPQDDGIEVGLPSSSPPAREDVDAYSRGIVYGPTPTPTRRRRLPVFAEICPEI